jgi:predicted acylesterase/phospholipase RssA
MNDRTKTVAVKQEPPEKPERSIPPDSLSTTSDLSDGCSPDDDSVKKNSPSVSTDQPIERLVFSGGGAKGIVYAGVYRALYTSGVLRGIKQVSGASAGAIMSAFVAAGTSPDYLRKVLLNCNLMTLMGTMNIQKNVETLGHYWMHSFFNRDGNRRPALLRSKIGESLITKDGDELKDFISYHFTLAVKMNLHQLKIEQKIPSTDPNLSALLEKIETPYPVITFADLSLLAQHFPETFKELSIVAVRHPRGEQEIFNASLTPHVEVTLACRASASIPALLKPVKIVVNGEGRTYVDGGYFNNIPTDIFDQDPQRRFMPNTKPLQTLVFVFESEDYKQSSAFKALYEHRWDEVLAGKWVTIATLINKEVLSLQQRKTGKNELVQKLLTQYSKEETAFIVSLILNGIDGSDHFGRKFSAYDGQVATLAEYFKAASVPVITSNSLLKKFILNKVLQMLADLNVMYEHTSTVEAGFQQVRQRFPLRTVPLHVASIDTTSFDEATKYGRIMDSLGFLDAFNYLSIHYLGHNDSALMSHVLNHAITIYNSMFVASHSNSHMSPFLTEFYHLQASLDRQDLNKLNRERELLYFFKKQAELDINGEVAYALSRAVELETGLTTVATITTEMKDNLMTSQSSSPDRKYYWEEMEQALQALVLPELPPSEPIDVLINQWTQFTVSLDAINDRIIKQKLNQRDTLELLFQVENIRKLGLTTDNHAETGKQFLLLMEKLKPLLAYSPTFIPIYHEIKRCFVQYYHGLQQFRLATQVSRLCLLQGGKALELPLFRRFLKFTAHQEPLQYTTSELDDLLHILNEFSLYQKEASADAEIITFCQQTSLIIENIMFAAHQKLMDTINHQTITILDLNQKINATVFDDPRIRGLLAEHQNTLSQLFKNHDILSQVATDKLFYVSAHLKSIQRCPTTKAKERIQVELISKLTSTIDALFQTSSELIMFNELSDRSSPSASASRPAL